MLVCTDFRFPPPGAAAASEDVQLQQLTAGTGAGTSASIETDGRGGSNNENGHRRAVRSSRRGDSDAFAFMPQLQSANNGNRRSGSPVRRADGRESRPGGGRGGSEGQAGRIGVAGTLFVISSERLRNYRLFCQTLRPNWGADGIIAGAALTVTYVSNSDSELFILNYGPNCPQIA